jgi:RimJ/RimL family protein N-acetyltransferase
LDSLHPQIKEWIPGDRLRAELARTVAGVIALVHDAEFATGFRAAVPVPGATLDDYKIKALEIDRDKTFVAGTRFRPDPPFSFVEVYARNYSIEDADTTTAMIEASRRAFEVFSPKYLRVHVPIGSIEDGIVVGPHVRTAFTTVAGLVSSLQRRSPPGRMECLRLAPAQSTDFYDRYLAEYEAFHEAVPSLRGLVPVAPRDTLEQSLAQGMLYEAYIDGEWAGVIAGREQTDYGMRGYRIIEELLSSRFRGQGLGPALQRHFIDALPAGDYQVLHGAIDPANAPSLATAKRVGRTEVMHARFIAL